MLKKFLNKSPKHIAFTLRDVDYWSEVNSKKIEEGLEKSNRRVLEVVDGCVKNDIKIFTFEVLGTDFNVSHFSERMDAVVKLLENLARNPLIHENKVKVSVLGKWYDLPSKVVDAIKQVADATADYDEHFLNLCLNYDGQDDILNALRVILRSIHYEKISPDNLTKRLIKDNIYSSYFISPEIIVLTHDAKTNGFLLWDSVSSLIYVSDVEWCDFDKKAFKQALNFYKDN